MGQRGHRGPASSACRMPWRWICKGRLYVGDRDNNRIQIFTQDGKLLGQLTQFGRPSGIAIDRNDTIYVTDSESKNKNEYGHHPGWKRGIRIGSLKDGIVTDFIPDTLRRRGRQQHQRRRRRVGRRQGRGLQRPVSASSAMS